MDEILSCSAWPEVDTVLRSTEAQRDPGRLATVEEGRRHPRLNVEGISSKNR